MTEPMKTLRVLFLKGSSAVVAQGLELDLTAQGADFDSAAEGFVAVLWAQAQLDMEDGRERFSQTPKAPQRYFDMAEAAEKVEVWVEPVSMDESVEITWLRAQS